MPTELFNVTTSIVNTDGNPRIDTPIYDYFLLLLVRLLDYQERGTTLERFWGELPNEIKTNVRTVAVKGILFNSKSTSSIGAQFLPNYLISIIQISTHACKILELLFGFSRSTVFECVSGFFERTNGATDFPTLHTRCILPYIFCNKGDSLRGLRDFVLGSASRIVPIVCDGESSMRLVDSGLYTLLQVEKRYENIRNANTFSRLTDALLVQQRRHRVLAKRALIFLTEIVKASKSVSAKFSEQIEGPVIAVTDGVLECYPEDEDLIKAAHAVLFLCIIECSGVRLEAMRERVPKIVDEIEGLARNATPEKEQNLTQTRFRAKLWLLTGIFRRFQCNLTEEASSGARPLRLSGK